MRKQPHEQYSGFRTPGVRLSEPQLPTVMGHSSEAELPALYAYHMFDKSHLVMLAEEGIIPKEDAVAMLRALRKMEADGVETVRLEVGGGMHSAEQYLIRKLGEDVGGRIHVGRSSGDLGRVALRVRQRDRLIELMHELNEFRAVVLDVAEQHLDTVMPGYTHSQHAQPVTFGFQLLAWVCHLERAFARADAAYSVANESPAGAAIMTGSNFPLNRHRTAELLGFDGVIKNTFYAILGNDDVALETFPTIATINLYLSRWASDLNFWFTSEAGYIDIPDRFCGTSSIMMQKKNPYALEYTRGAVADSMGGLVTAFAALKAATGEANQDRRYLYESLWRSFDLAVRGLRWYSEMLPAIKVNKERMLQMAGAHWAQATDVAGALVSEKELPWRTAHQIVGILVRLTEERGIKPMDVTADLLDEASVEYMGEPVGLDGDSLTKALDPAEFVTGRTLYGGPAPEESMRRLPEYREQLDRDREAVGARARGLEAARDRLEQAIDALVGG